MVETCCEDVVDVTAVEINVSNHDFAMPGKLEPPPLGRQRSSNLRLKVNGSVRGAKVEVAREECPACRKIEAKPTA